MVPAATSAVTPQGVRDGDPLVLAALTERRGGAVLAYCEAVAPGEGAVAAADAFARFRRDVVAARNPLALDPEVALVRATRLAAAAHAPRVENGGGGLLGRRGGACGLVPELLAARAEGRLTDGDRGRLARHLERCPACRAAEERFRAAERAYRDAADGPPPQPVALELMRALLGAAPNLHGGAVKVNGHSAEPPGADSATTADGATAQFTPLPPEDEPAVIRRVPPPATEAARAAAGVAPENEPSEEDAPDAEVARPEPLAAEEPVAAAAEAEPAEAPEPEPEQPTLSWDVDDVHEAVAEADRGGHGRAGQVVARIVVPGLVVGAALAGGIVAGGAFAPEAKVSDAITVPIAPPAASFRPAPTITTPLPPALGAAPEPAATGAQADAAAAQPAAAPAAAPRTQQADAAASTPATTGDEAAPPQDGAAPADGEGFQAAR